MRTETEKQITKSQQTTSKALQSELFLRPCPLPYSTASYTNPSFKEVKKLTFSCVRYRSTQQATVTRSYRNHVDDVRRARLHT